MAVLYRKYRPQRFAEVIGQDHIISTLRSEIIQSHLAHAYLFVGPRGTGKTTVARLLARTLNCEMRAPDDPEPCNKCATCIHVTDERYLDVIEIDAATHTQVEKVRDTIIAAINIPPLRKNGYKVFIIDEVHMLSRHAFNALLKTLEEPPERVIFILATTNAMKVPDTIISRCQRFDFKHISYVHIIKRLSNLARQEKITISEKIVAHVARQAQGSLRDAESLLGQLFHLADKGSVSAEDAALVMPQRLWDHALTLAKHLQQRNLSAALNFISTLITDGIDIDALTDDLIELFRHMLLIRVIGSGYQIPLDDALSADVAKRAHDFAISDLQRLLNIFILESQRLRYAPIPQLALELGCVDFCKDALEQGMQPVSTDAKMPEPRGHASTPNVDDSIIQLKHQWHELLTTLKDYNHSLAVFLKVAHPLRIENNTLTIGFKYDFHAETIMKNKNKKSVEEAIGDLLKKKVRIACVVDAHYDDNHKSFNGTFESEVKNVLDAFGGGEVV